MIINRKYEHQNLLSLLLVPFLVGLRTYQHPCTSKKLHNILLTNIDILIIPTKLFAQCFNNE